jgi:hypothetical protein
LWSAPTKLLVIHFFHSELIYWSDTRWNSAHDALKLFYQLRSPISQTLKEGHEHHLSDEDWSGLKKIVDFLEPFSRLTTLIGVKNKPKLLVTIKL